MKISREQARRYNAAVFFITVYNPREYSFQSLTSSELENIEKSINKHQFPIQTENQQINAAAYQQVIGHVSHWRRTYQERIAPVDFAGYLDGLFQYVNSQNIKENNDISFDELKNKLEYILSVADSKDKRQKAENKIMQVNYRDLYEAVPGVPQDHLLHLFRSFMMPISEIE